MENEEISKYLTEKMGLCWHEWEEFFPSFVCSKCGFDYDDFDDNGFFSPDGFFILWNWIIEQDWFPSFWVSNTKSNMLDIIDYETFPIKIYNYLKESE